MEEEGQDLLDSAQPIEKEIGDILSNLLDAYRTQDLTKFKSNILQIPADQISLIESASAILLKLMMTSTSLSDAINFFENYDNRSKFKWDDFDPIEDEIGNSINYGLLKSFQSNCPNSQLLLKECCPDEYTNLSLIKDSHLSDALDILQLWKLDSTRKPFLAQIARESQNYDLGDDLNLEEESLYLGGAGFSIWSWDGQSEEIESSDNSELGCSRCGKKRDSCWKSGCTNVSIQFSTGFDGFAKVFSDERSELKIITADLTLEEEDYLSIYDASINFIPIVIGELNSEEIHLYSGTNLLGIGGGSDLIFDLEDQEFMTLDTLDNETYLLTAWYFCSLDDYDAEMLIKSMESSLITIKDWLDHQALNDGTLFRSKLDENFPEEISFVSLMAGDWRSGFKSVLEKINNTDQIASS